MRFITVLALVAVLAATVSAVPVAPRYWWSRNCKRFGIPRVLFLAVKHGVPSNPDNIEISRTATLVQVDADTWGTTTIGVIKGADGVEIKNTIIAFDDLSGRLFGTGVRPATATDVAVRVLIEIDTSTAEAISETPLALASGLDDANFVSLLVADLTFTGNGYLFMTVNGGEFSNAYRINVDSGLVDVGRFDTTAFGDLYVAPGLSLDENDNIQVWGVDLDIAVDPVTNAESFNVNQNSVGTVTFDQAAFPTTPGVVEASSIVKTNLYNLPANCRYPHIQAADVIARGVPFFKEARAVVRCDLNLLPEPNQSSCLAAVFPKVGPFPRPVACINILPAAQGSWASVALRRSRNCFSWF